MEDKGAVIQTVVENPTVLDDVGKYAPPRRRGFVSKVFPVIALKDFFVGLSNCDLNLRIISSRDSVA